MKSKYSVFDLQEAVRGLDDLLSDEYYAYFSLEYKSLVCAVGVIEEELKRRESTK